MAFTSLAYQAVPTGSDGALQQATLLMPKLSYRFRILFQGFGISDTTELTRQVVDFTRPQVQFETITLPIYNSTVYLAGKPSWQEVTLNLRDDATGQIQRRVGQQLQKQFDFQEQASAAAGINYKFNMSCQILDGARGISVPNILEAWELYGCYITNANYNQLNYGDNSDMKITLNIRFDNATQAPLDGDGPAYGVGEAIGRRAGTITGDVVSGAGTPG